MTPAARVAAAIAVLDAVLDGEALEKALTNWARRNRYAGSGDRAAVRDHVYDAMRNRRSFGWLGGADTGRGLMLGACRARGEDPATLFSGARYAPPPLSADDEGQPLSKAPRAVQLDVPDWVLDRFDADLGDSAASVAQALKSRAPVFLRVNTGKTTRAAAMARLAEDQIVAVPHDLADTALEIVENARRLRDAAAYRDGWVELQDAASQAVCAALPVAPGMRVLDYCAGGGGKALALAAMGAEVFAHDANPRRMRDIPVRAARAGVAIHCLDDPAQAAPFDLVLCDAPCSGSGTWRRTPQGKWSLSPARLEALQSTQGSILDTANSHVKPGGTLHYCTCSVFDSENDHQISAFLLRNTKFEAGPKHKYLPLNGADGFCLFQLKRKCG